MKHHLFEMQMFNSSFKESKNTFENPLGEKAVNVHPVGTYGRHEVSAGLLS